MRGVSIVAFNPLRERDYAGMLSRIEAPTLIIHGRKDCIVPLVVGQFCASTISNATLSVFENSGHSPFAEEPERFKRRDLARHQAGLNRFTGSRFAGILGSQIENTAPHPRPIRRRRIAYSGQDGHRRQSRSNSCGDKAVWALIAARHRATVKC